MVNARATTGVRSYRNPMASLGGGNTLEPDQTPNLLIDSGRAI